MFMEKGYKTSEFWVTTFASIGSILNQAGFLGAPLPVDAIAYLVGLVAPYVLGRSVIKARGVK
jgi:hypothetical protein